MEALMYAVIRKFNQMRSVDEAGRRAAEGLGPMLKKSKGFIAYYVVRFGDQAGGSITLFDTQEAARDAHSKALAWIKTNLADLSEGEPEVMAGEVLASVIGEGAPGARATAA
jgi:hypothetical protein